MYRINTARDAIESGRVEVDAGEGVTLTVPVEPVAGNGVYHSGLRNIADLLLEGWRPYSTAQAIGARIFRSDTTVTLALDLYWDGANLDEVSVGGLTTFAQVLPLPSGFQPIGSGYIAPTVVASNPGAENLPGIGTRPTGWWDSVQGTLRVRQFNATVYTGARFTAVVSWTTLDPIPTTLPGTPA